MAGLVPAIHVVKLHVSEWPRCASRTRRASGQYFAFDALDDVDDRDKPGHDGVE
jgi:hypothetical protein